MELLKQLGQKTDGGVGRSFALGQGHAGQVPDVAVVGMETLTRTLLDRSLWQWVGRSLWLWLDRSLMWVSLGTLTRTWHNSGRGVV